MLIRMAQNDRNSIFQYLQLAITEVIEIYLIHYITCLVFTVKNIFSSRKYSLDVWRWHRAARLFPHHYYFYFIPPLVIASHYITVSVMNDLLWPLCLKREVETKIHGKGRGESINGCRFHDSLPFSPFSATLSALFYPPHVFFNSFSLFPLFPLFELASRLLILARGIYALYYHLAEYALTKVSNIEYSMRKK